MSDDTDYGRLGIVVFLANAAAISVVAILAVWYGKRKLPEAIDAASQEIEAMMPSSPLDLIFGGGGGGPPADGMAGMFGVGGGTSDELDHNPDFPAGESDRGQFFEDDSTDDD